MLTVLYVLCCIRVTRYMSFSLVDFPCAESDGGLTSRRGRAEKGRWGRDKFDL